MTKHQFQQLQTTMGFWATLILAVLNSQHGHPVYAAAWFVLSLVLFFA